MCYLLRLKHLDFLSWYVVGVALGFISLSLPVGMMKSLDLSLGNKALNPLDRHLLNSAQLPTIFYVVKHD